MIENAYAKINLTLDVFERRPDGFHDIETVMQLVSLCDVLTLTGNTLGELRLTSNVGFIPLDGKNICAKAAAAFFDRFSVTERGFDINIRKRIPVAAGLGGGSADGAAVIRLLARRFGVTDRGALLEVAAAVGSDVPFCLVGGTALCRGRGEIMDPLSSAMTRHLVIAKNTVGLSTPLIYSLFDQQTSPRSHPGSDAVIRALADGDPDALDKSIFNAMEPVSAAKRPAIEYLKNKMLSYGASVAMMSGSGPSVFGLFPDEASARTCAEKLKKKNVRAYYARFLNDTLL